MASVNKVILIGNLGRDPEMRYTPSGSAICSLRIATARTWKNKDSGERVEETEWHSVVMYDRLAEVAGEYLRKGSPVYVEGRLKTRKWQDKDGNDRYTTEIVAEEMKMLGGGREGAAAPAPAPRDAAHRPAPAPRPAAAPAARPTGGGGGSAGLDDMDGDIPFAFADYSTEPVTGLHRRMRRYGF